MSLINDVLKDLERRNAPESLPARQPSERAAPEAPGTRRWPLWLIAALGVGLVLHLTLNDSTSSAAPETGEPLTAQARSQPAPAATETDAPSSPHPIEADEPSRPDDLPPASQGPIATAATRSDSSPARAPQRQSDRNRSDGDARTESSPAPVGEDPRPNPPETMPLQSAPSQSTPSRAPPDASISIRRADVEPDEPDSLAAAKRMLSRGQVERAQSRLRELLDQQPGLTEAHELLASLLIRRRQHNAAESALESGLSKASDPPPLAALLGRLLIERGEAARARSVLERHAPELADNPDYHLLLAAACRQAGDHVQAAEYYRRLSDHLPRRGAVWIGLGASLESLERPRAAVDAYNRALDGDDERAARFARERLSALAPITAESK